MEDKKIKPGSGGRPPGCFYIKEDHDRAATHVRQKTPEISEWIKAHPDGLPDDTEKHQLFWRTAMEILPMASLVDLAKVGLKLRLQANPLSDADQERIEQLLLRSKEWQQKRRH